MRAAIYVRQSLDRSGEGLGVARQRCDCLELVGKRGWDVADVYVDNDVSASSRKPRPAYGRMLQAVQAGQADVIVAWASDRLHRRLSDLTEFVDVVNKAGVQVATVKSGDLDLSTPHGRMLAGILGSVAQAEVEQKGLRQVRANRQRADAGVARFSRRPYGYDMDRKHLVADEAALLHEAARSVLAGASLLDATKRLNADGATTTAGGPWTATTLRTNLKNPRYAGLNAYKGEIIGHGDWEAIWSEETHHALVTLFSDPQRRKSPTNARRYLLSGLVRCGLCGDPLFAAYLGAPGSYRTVYRCRKQHLARVLEKVDEVVEAVAVARLQRPDALELITADDGEDTLQLREDAAVLRLRLDEAAGLFASGAITASQLSTITAETRDRLRQIEARQATSRSGSILHGVAGAEDVPAIWAALSLSRKRAIIDLLFVATALPAGRGVRFSPEQIEIEWRQ